MAVPKPQPPSVVERLNRNEEAIRFILSLLHPAPINIEGAPPVSTEAWHQALMGWLDLYGGRVVPPELEEG